MERETERDGERDRDTVRWEISQNSPRDEGMRVNAERLGEAGIVPPLGAEKVKGGIESRRSESGRVWIEEKVSGGWFNPERGTEIEENRGKNQRGRGGGGDEENVVCELL